MMHENRRWSPKPESVTPEEAARLLTEYTWTTCTALRVTGEGGTYLLLNDSTGGDGAQEYAVVRIDHEEPGEIVGVMVESLTVSWMDRANLTAQLSSLIAGENNDYGAVRARLHPTGERCGACA